MDRSNWISLFKYAFRRDAGFSFEELGDTGKLDEWHDSHPDVPLLAGRLAAEEALATIGAGDWLSLE